MKNILFRFRLQKHSLLVSTATAFLAFSICFFVCHSTKSALFFSVLLFLTAFVEIQFTKPSPIVTALMLTTSAFISCVCSQIICTDFVSSFYFVRSTQMVINLLCCLALIAIINFFTSNVNFSSSIVLFLTCSLATVNKYIIAFRGTELTISDLTSIRTALSVADNYQFFKDHPVIYGWLFVLLWCVILVGCIQLPRFSRLPRHYVISFASTLICIFIAATQIQTLPRFDWKNEGSSTNGFVANFLLNSFNSTYSKPGYYDQFDFLTQESLYPDNTNHNIIPPHIVVVMNESFSDLRIYENSTYGVPDVMPFYDSLEKNAVKGYTLSSVFGGTTANSEYEFLTGNTIAFMPSGVSAFQRYVEPGAFSYAAYLESLGYRSIAMHTEDPINWTRKAAWPALGFDETHFSESFPRADLIRNMVSDREVYTQLISMLKEHNSSTPLFLFCVTMQNHGGYENKGYESTVELSDFSQEYPKAEQYLSLIRESDTALQMLISELSQLDENVLLLFYGDHQPKIEIDFLEELHGGAFHSLDEQQLQYTVPYLLWANYDIPEQDSSLTSLNYLGHQLLECAKLPLPPYGQFLKELSQHIPSMNSHGFYSTSSQTFLPYEEAQGIEKEWLNTYSILQYNSIFEDQNRSTLFQITK